MKLCKTHILLAGCLLAFSAASPAQEMFTATACVYHDGNHHMRCPPVNEIGGINLEGLEPDLVTAVLVDLTSGNAIDLRAGKSIPITMEKGEKLIVELSTNRVDGARWIVDETGARLLSRKFASRETDVGSGASGTPFKTTWMFDSTKSGLQTMEFTYGKPGSTPSFTMRYNVTIQ